MKKRGIMNELLILALFLNLVACVTPKDRNQSVVDKTKSPVTESKMETKRQIAQNSKYNEFLDDFNRDWHCLNYVYNYVNLIDSYHNKLDKAKSEHEKNKIHNTFREKNLECESRIQNMKIKGKIMVKLLMPPFIVRLKQSLNEYLMNYEKAYDKILN